MCYLPYTVAPETIAECDRYMICMWKYERNTEREAEGRPVRRWEHTGQGNQLMVSYTAHYQTTGDTSETLITRRLLVLKSAPFPGFCDIANDVR